MSMYKVAKSRQYTYRSSVSVHEDGHYQAPKQLIVPYAENTLYSTNKYSCVRPVHTLYTSYENIKILAKEFAKKTRQPDARVCSTGWSNRHRGVQHKMRCTTITDTLKQ